MLGAAISNVYIWSGFTNGYIPLGAMVRLDDVDGQWVSSVAMYAHPETAARVRWIMAECKRQGLTSIHPNEIYRSYDGQVYWKNYWTSQGKPGNAATPGGSPHGYGYAVDWNFADSEYDRFVEICRRAGMLFNIDGENWHNAPIANAKVDLTGLGITISGIAQAITKQKEEDMSAPVAYIERPWNRDRFIIAPEYIWRLHRGGDGATGDIDPNNKWVVEQILKLELDPVDNEPNFLRTLNTFHVPRSEFVKLMSEKWDGWSAKSGHWREEAFEPSALGSWGQ